MYNHKIIIDRNTLRVLDYDVDVKAFQFPIYIGSIDFTKVDSTTSKQQKVNLFGEKLYSLIEGTAKHEVTQKEFNGRMLPPVFVKVTKQDEIKFTEQPHSFSLEEILNEKVTQMMKEYSYENCGLCEINLQDEVDTSYENHKADIGYKVIRVHPEGEAKLKPITLGETKKIKVVLESSNAIKVECSVNGEDYVELNDDFSTDKEIETIVLKFVNESEIPVDIISFAILH